MQQQRQSNGVDSPESLERSRLRRNQRNSRARKQAYVRDLEERWNECVKLGAQATIEMQREARRVQEENRLLWAVLHRYGLDDPAIQHAIETEKHASSVAHAAKTTIPCDQLNSPRQHQVTVVEASASACSTEFAPFYPTSDISAVSWLDMTDAVGGGVTIPLGSSIDQDLSQVVNLQNWLSDLCSIKDAFGAEASNLINEDLLRADVDRNVM